MSIKRTVIILGTAVLMAIVYNQFSANGLKLFGTATQTYSDKLKRNDEKSKSELAKWSVNPDKLAWHKIRSDQLYYVFEHKMGIIIDPRDEWDYSESHIKGAINFPFYKFDELKNQIPFNKNDLVVVYCEDNNCDLGKSLCDSLVNMKFKNIFLYKGGIDEWKFAQYPIDKSKLKIL